VAACRAELQAAERRQAALGAVDVFTTAAAGADATTATPARSTQAATPSWGHGARVRANERVVEAFLQDVVNEHNGDHADRHLQGTLDPLTPIHSGALLHIVLRPQL
jgi:hypothetical protein